MAIIRTTYDPYRGMSPQEESIRRRFKGDYARQQNEMERMMMMIMQDNGWVGSSPKPIPTSHTKSELNTKLLLCK